MDGPAAALLGRDEHVAAVLLQDAQRGPMGRAEHGVGHAADEERHPGPLPPHGRQKLRQPRAQFDRRRQQRNHAAQPAGNQLHRPIRSAKSNSPMLLHKPHRHEQLVHPIGIGEKQNRTISRNQSNFSSGRRSACLTARRNGSISRP